MARKVSTNPGDVSLSKRIDSRLKLYGTAAAAASVGLLALAEPAQSEIVITNKNIPIPFCFVSCPVMVDLNHDGNPDFSFMLVASGYKEAIHAYLDVTPLDGGGAMGGRFSSFASALVRGAKIGPSARFVSYRVKLEQSSQCAYSCSGQYSHRFGGPWGGNHPNRFVGVKFLIHGKTHYGWIRVTVTTNKNAPMSAEITEYGYETIANKSCGAGLSGPSAAASDRLNLEQTSKNSASLGMLAAGSEGMPLWREETSVRP